MQWVLVYICEAHAADTWPMKWSVEWPRPVSLLQRAVHAYVCERDLAIGARVLVDGMDDAFNEAFGSWPTAYYCADRTGKLLYVGTPPDGEAAYDVFELISWLRKWKSTEGRRAVAGRRAHQRSTDRSVRTPS